MTATRAVLERDAAYRERNRLVALLAALYPSYLVRHDEREGEPWDEEWRNVVLIDLPTGQISFHIHSSELLTLFDRVKIGHNEKWDGHTNEEKWRRIQALADIHNAHWSAV